MTTTATTAPTSGRRRRLRTALALVAASLGLVVGPLTLPAFAAGQVTTFAVQAGVEQSGLVTVRQTITFQGAAPGTLTQQLETRENLVGDRQYVQTISDVTASAGGQPLALTIDDDDPYTTIEVKTGGASGPIEIDYQVVGAVVNGPSGPVLRLRLLQGLSAPVDQVTATVTVPGISYVKCVSGSPNSTMPCDFAAGGTEDAQQPTFRDGPRGQGEVVAVEIGLPVGTVTANERVEYRWTVARAFSAQPLPLGIALGLLVLGGLGLLALHRRGGTDRSAGNVVTSVGEFVPVGPGQTEFRGVGDVRPGHVGTVADERVDPIDVTATLLDLAVRGHLLITELPRASEFAPVDWMLTRQPGVDPSTLRPFEAKLLDGVTVDGDEVRVSAIANRVQGAMGDVQSALYDEMVEHGWYERRPDATRNKWTQWALGLLIVAVVVVGVLAAFTSYGLVGLALVALALAFVVVAQEMPSRTAKGAALMAGLGALRGQLLSQPTDQMPPGAELRELSEVLPYAVVLGGVDRWLDAIVATDDDDDPDSTDLPWYHGPDAWHLRDLPYSLKNFITTTSGTLFSR
ncbi:MAG: DUF2207 family protein [Propionibacteriaceae bacterium]